jgi:Holliday junction resolvasome RuvABC DNA-binding subunit
MVMLKKIPQENYAKAWEFALAYNDPDNTSSSGGYENVLEAIVKLGFTEAQADSIMIPITTAEKRLAASCEVAWKLENGKSDVTLIERRV